MPTAPLLRHVRRLAEAGAPAPSDRDLLLRFAGHRDEAAFEALVRRHGPMILRLCRRTLRCEQDAEDVFQAAFLVLARKAPSVRWRESVGTWLYEVAYRLCLRARRGGARRVRHESRVPARAPADPHADTSLRECQAVLDEELSRLPERLRAPVVLCCLEGATRDEAAGWLGLSLATLKRRLEQGRALLRRRLAGRGVVPSVALAGVALAPGAASALLPGRLLDAARAAALSPAGVSARAVALAAGLARAGVVARIKVGLLVLLTGAAVVGAGAMPGRNSSPGQQPETPPPAPAQAVPARGEPVGDSLPPGATARLGTRSFRAGSHIVALALSPDGKTLVTGEGDAVRWWDAATGKELRRWNASVGPNNGALAFSPDGKTLVTASGRDADFVSWDVAAGTQLRRFDGHRAPVLALAVSPDGRLVASGGEDKSVRLWELTGNKGSELPLKTTPPADPAARGVVRMPELRRLGEHEGAVTSVAFARDGKTVVTGGADKTVRVWDVASGKERLRIPGYEGRVLAVAAAPGGGVIASCGADGTVRLHRADTGKEIRRWAAALPDMPFAAHPITFSPDGRSLALGGWDGVIRRWDAATGDNLPSLKGHCGAVSAVAFSADGKMLFSGSHDKTVRCWDVAAAKEVRAPAGHAGGVSAVAYSPDGKTVATGGEDRTVRLWDAATGKELRRFHGGPNEFVLAVAFAPDGKTLAAAHNQTVRVWDVATGREVRALAGHRNWVSSLAFSSDGRSLVTASGDETVRLWDVAAGRQLREFPVPANIVWWSVALSPDAKTVAAGGQTYDGKGCLRLFDRATGKERPQLQEQNILAFALAFSPNGETLAAATEAHAVRLWDLATGKPARQWKVDGYPFPIPFPIAFSADGRCLAAGCHDKATVRVWEVATGGERCRFQGHRGGIKSVAFAPDGRRLVTGSDDTSALVWDLTDAAAPAAEERSALWDDLGSGDAATSYRAICALGRAPAETTTLLKARLRPVAAVEAGSVAKLIADLDSAEFDVRDKAAAELGRLGASAEPALRRAREGKLSAEAARQVRSLLEKRDGWTAERLRELRALEVLERVGTPEARQVLRDLAGGVAGAWLTREAKASLERLERRP